MILLRLAVPLLIGLLTACASGVTGEHVVRAEFRCEDGRKLHVLFNTTRDLAVVQLSKKISVELPSQRPASGMWYKGSGYELRGAGDTLTFSGDAQAPTRCTQVR